jgi:hypothetical protein
METITNPFNVSEVLKIIDENKKPIDWWKDFLLTNEPIIENEFYILFENGLLVKKGRSKFKTSDYLMNKKFKNFKSHYEEVQISGKP